LADSRLYLLQHRTDSTEKITAYCTIYKFTLSNTAADHRQTVRFQSTSDSKCPKHFRLFTREFPTGLHCGLTQWRTWDFARPSGGYLEPRKRVWCLFRGWNSEVLSASPRSASAENFRRDSLEDYNALDGIQLPTFSSQRSIRLTQPQQLKLWCSITNTNYSLIEQLESLLFSLSLSRSLSLDQPSGIRFQSSSEMKTLLFQTILVCSAH